MKPEWMLQSDELKEWNGWHECLKLFKGKISIESCYACLDHDHAIAKYSQKKLLEYLKALVKKTYVAIDSGTGDLTNGIDIGTIDSMLKDLEGKDGR